MEASKERMDFLRELHTITGENVMLCDLCQKCTEVCPTAYAMAMKPHELLRALQLGEVEQIIWSGAIWLCLSCEACNASCPQKMDILRLINGLKEMSGRLDSYNPEASTASMNRIFLSLVERWGRIHLLPLMILTHLKMLAPFKDMELMSPLLMKRKVKLLPREQDGAKSLRQMVSKIRASERPEGTKKD